MRWQSRLTMSWTDRARTRGLCRRSGKHHTGDRCDAMSGFDSMTDRLRRQRAGLGEIGACALRMESLDHLLGEACRIVADCLGARFCKVLEFRAEAQTCWCVLEWVGRGRGRPRHAECRHRIAGRLRDADRPARDLQRPCPRDPFPNAVAAVRHGIKRAINVLICGDGQSFGVLEVDSRGPGDFTDDDTAFLQAAANLLGIALERTRRQQELQAALEAHDLLAREADHRIKNSLQLIASLLTLQRSRLSDTQASAALDDAISRVQAVAAIHRVMNESADLRTVACGRMLEDLCQHFSQLGSGIEVRARVEVLPLDAERAIPLGLIVSELLTNVMRHAYPEGGPGAVEVTAGRDGEQIRIVVADQGAGFEPGADEQPSLGSMIVRALARQIGAELEVASQPTRGTTVTLLLLQTPP